MAGCDASLLAGDNVVLVLMSRPHRRKKKTDNSSDGLDLIGDGLWRRVLDEAGATIYVRVAPVRKATYGRSRTF